MWERSVMVIHGGGVYGDKPGAKDGSKDIENYLKKLKERLVLENRTSYSIKDCLKYLKNRCTYCI